MFKMWDVRDVGCSGCWMLGMWDVRDVGCLGCGMFAGMWDVDLQNAVFILILWLFIYSTLCFLNKTQHLFL